jgi:hypothetical protein
VEKLNRSPDDETVLVASFGHEGAIVSTDMEALAHNLMSCALYGRVLFQPYAQQCAVEGDGEALERYLREVERLEKGFTDVVTSLAALRHQLRRLSQQTRSWAEKEHERLHRNERKEP